METRQMRQILAVADCGSLTHAAELLGIAQPALSQSIARVERDLGLRLFIRSRRGTQLTRTCQTLIEEIRQCLLHARNVQRLAHELAHGRSGQITVGFISSALWAVLPKAMHALRCSYPDISVTLREMNHLEQARALERNEIDLGIMYSSANIRGRMHEKRLLRDHCVAAVPEDFPAAEDGTVTLAQLSAAGLVWFPEQNMPGIRAAILSAIRRAGHEANIAQEAARILTVLSYVASGCAVSLLPSSVRAVNFAGVVYREVSDGENLPRLELSAVWPARSRLGPVEHLISALPSLTPSLPD